MDNLIFGKSQIDNIVLKNRIIRSATYEGMADENGNPTDELKKKYVALAKGGAGAIITGCACIQQDGKAPYYRCVMSDTDACIEPFKRLVDAVHEYETPIILQIAHCGRQTRSKITGLPTVAPSAIKDKMFIDDIPVELSEEGIKEIIENFAKSVERAKAAGFDGVQLHLAHGYLLSSFLSPYMNRRNDKWGGSTENRFRIVREIFEKAKACAPYFPILVKMNAHEAQKGGMNIDEAVKIAKMLEQVGCSAIEVSCGIQEDGFNTIRGQVPAEALLKYNFKLKDIPEFMKIIMKPCMKFLVKHPKPYENYNVEYAAQIKMNVNIPVIVVGGIGSIDDISEIIQMVKADYVSMSRPFIIEPDIVDKFREGKQKNTRCINCNFCALAMDEKPLRCYYGKVPSGE